MVDLVDRMRDLATHNRDDDTRTSKRDKASLRTAFRSILASVEGSGAKADKVGGSRLSPAGITPLDLPHPSRQDGPL